MKKFLATLFIISLSACSSTGDSEAKRRADEFAKTQDFKDLVAARNIIKKTPRKFINLNPFTTGRCDDLVKQYLTIEKKVIARKASGSEALKKANQYKKECSNK